MSLDKFFTLSSLVSYLAEVQMLIVDFDTVSNYK